MRFLSCVAFVTVPKAVRLESVTVARVECRARCRQYVVSLTEAEELGSREVEIESKKFLIEIKANDQGKFVKILEVGCPTVGGGGRWWCVCTQS